MKIMICGSGQIFYYSAKSLAAKKHHLTIVCPDHTECRTLAQESYAEVIWGDPTDERILEEIGLSHTEVVMAMFLNDSDNYVVTQLALRKFQVPRIITLVNNPVNDNFFRKMGIDNTLNFPNIVNVLIEENAG